MSIAKGANAAKEANTKESMRGELVIFCIVDCTKNKKRSLWLRLLKTVYKIVIMAVRETPPLARSTHRWHTF